MKRAYTFERRPSRRSSQRASKAALVMASPGDAVTTT